MILTPLERHPLSFGGSRFAPLSASLTAVGVEKPAPVPLSERLAAQWRCGSKC